MVRMFVLSLYYTNYQLWSAFHQYVNERLHLFAAYFSGKHLKRVHQLLEGIQHEKENTCVPPPKIHVDSRDGNPSVGLKLEVSLYQAE